MELVVAAMILVISVSLSMMGLVFMISEVRQGDKQSELDIEVQLAMERIIRDLRLSSLDKIFYYPAGVGPHTAISFPLARDDDGDGAIDVDGDGKIIWDQTLVYHVWGGNPNQLRLTTFDPRDETLNETERQEQLDSVVSQGNGGSTHNATNAASEILFENVFDWELEPKGSRFDGYASELTREVNELLGSIVLSSGNHTFEFTVADKNASSSSYKIGLDKIFVSPSYGAREGEAQLPPSSQSGAAASNEYIASGSWSGNYQLVFPATATGSTFTLTLENDRWEETNFQGVGHSTEETTVIFDGDLSPLDFVVSLEGMQTNWYASLQTGDASNAAATADSALGQAVRVPIRGGELENGNWIDSSGAKARVNFYSGSGPLHILDAFIAEASSSDTPSMDAAAASTTRLTFGGSDNVVILAATNQWSDLVNFEIDKDKTYLVTYLVDSVAGSGNVWQWNEMLVPTAIGAYFIPASNAPTFADAMLPNWSSLPDVYSTNVTFAVASLFATYPTNGLYTTRIFDAAQDAPNYLNLGWNEVLPMGTDIRFRVRSGTNSLLVDAADWSTITPISSPATINPGDYRYIQLQAEMFASASSLQTPKLQDFTVRWDGEERLTDIGGTFTKGPDYGIFELKVDGQELVQGIIVDLEIFDYIRIHGGSNEVRSSLTAEVSPRNTGS